MRRYLPLGLLLALLAHLSGCGESPNRPSVVAETPVNPPKTRARFIQVPWDISLFFNIPGGAVVAGATTAATSGGAAEGDNLTGTFVNSTGFAGTLTGVLTGNLENGTFNGSLSTITRSGCTAERRFSGPITTTTLNWSPGAHINDCGGTSPLTSGIQAAAAPSTAPPPCTYQASATGTSVPSAGGAGTVSVTAGEGCTWFATSSADFVRLSVSEGTAAGSVQFTVAANTATTQRTAILVVAGQSFTITQAPAPAPVCTYRLNGGDRTFDASGALGGVDMRVAAGCAWQAQSDSPWLTITGGASGSGDGTISYAVAANPGLAQRVGTITATGDQDFTVTQLGIVCAFTVTPPATVSFATAGGTGTASVVTQSPCPWTAASSVSWITITPPPGATGNGAVSFTVLPNPDPVVRSGVLTVAGHDITITQAAAPCSYTLTANPAAFPEAGGSGTLTIATHAACPWNAVSGAQWITLSGTTSGSGPATVPFTVARNGGAARTGTISIAAGQSVTISQAQSTVGIVSGTVTNNVNGQPVSGATVTIGNLTGTTATNGTYSIGNVPLGAQTVRLTAPEFIARSDQITVTFVTTHNPVLTAAAPALTFTFTPNPAFPNLSNLHCGMPENQWCWQSTSTIRDTGGATLTVTNFVINLRDPAGNLQTFQLTSEFSRFYGAGAVPAGGALASLLTVWFTNTSGGLVEIVLEGVDTFNRRYTFLSTPPLTASPTPIGLRAVTPGGRSAGSSAAPVGRPMTRPR